MRNPFIKLSPKPKFKGYTTCDIPAKLFFKMIASGDYSILGEGAPQEQEDAFYKIFDEYHLLEDNNGVKSIYRKTQRVTVLTLQIEFISTALNQIAFVPMTKDERLAVIGILNSLDGCKVKFSIDKPIKDEIHRVQTKILGFLRNELQFELSREQKEKKGAVMTYERELASIAAILSFYPHSDITLAEFVELRKLAHERVKAQNNGK